MPRIRNKISNSQVFASFIVKPVRLSKDNLSLLLLFIGLMLLLQTDSQLFELITSTLSDAYLGVSIFIALTLAGFYALDRYFEADLVQILNQRNRLQIPMASLLGALPGCGGAIIVVTQFVNGQMSFGALVAVLISTMGDAAFLLLSRKPDIALAVYSTSLVAGILFGYAVNFIHGSDYLKSENTAANKTSSPVPRLPSPMTTLFLCLLVPGSVMGILEAFQVDSNQLFGAYASLEPAKWLGFSGALLCIVVWLSQPFDSWSSRFAEKPKTKYLKETVVAETSFVSVWVILGFLSYELLVYFTGLNLDALFQNLGVVAILFAILIGFVPGCGPQIVVTTLYINGVVPLSAQLANAISNDGDALFPAIALAPEAAMKATVYSAIPAFIIGYGAFFMGW
ncbi:putative manganese transporter [Spongorhabdus nitratireducens]